MVTEKPSRRSVLQRIAAVGAAGVSITSAPVAAGSTTRVGNLSNIQVKKVEDDSRNRVFTQVLKHDDFRAILRDFISLGHTPMWSEVKIAHVTEENEEERHVFQLPFRARGSEDYVFIQYNGLDGTSAGKNVEMANVGGSIIKVKYSETPSANSSDGEERGRRKMISFESYAADDGTIERHSGEEYKDEMVQERVGTQSGPGYLDPGGGSGCPTCMHKSGSHCEDIDWGCVALNAGAFATAITACAVCGASAGWLIPACGYCVGAVLTSGGTFIVCDMGGQCEPEFSCVPEELDNEHNLCDG